MTIATRQLLRISCRLVMMIALALPAHAQPSFDGAPEPQRGVFIKLVDPLDDKRGFCIDIPGHLQGVRVDMALVVHTCKDGFWNYDERFDDTAFKADGQLKMPAFDRCLAVDQLESGTALQLTACDQANARQGWAHVDGQLRLSAQPKLCLTVADTASEVSRGTRNHPVRHLVRPLSLALCSPQLAALQRWAFTPPSAIPGVRYPDGSTRRQ
jgi:hypothetical protein